jgi:hypothetical protein
LENNADNIINNVLIKTEMKKATIRNLIT